ncbi:MAG: DUF4440 domain-containing protein [Paracoccaceae bacterium]
MDPGSAALAEIDRLHVFIAGWFRGDVKPEEFGKGFADVLHPEFVNIQPSGQIRAKDDLLDSIKSAHGANPDFTIAIETPQVVACYPGAVVATYVEYQTGARNSATENRRYSTALFEVDGDQVIWRHLQETGL